MTWTPLPQIREITCWHSPQPENTIIIDTDNKNGHQQKHTHTKAPKHTPICTPTQSIIQPVQINPPSPSIASTYIRQPWRAGQPNEKQAKLLKLQSRAKVSVDVECEYCCKQVWPWPSWLNFVAWERVGLAWGTVFCRSCRAMRARAELGWECTCYPLVPYSILSPPLAWLVPAWVVETTCKDECILWLDASSKTKIK